MKLSMAVDFKLLKKDAFGGFVPMCEDEVKSVDIGGFCFGVGKHNIPFDWTAYSGSWGENGHLSFVTGYGWMNDFELDECFDGEYAKLGIKREDISAKMLASTHHIEEFYVDFELATADGIKEYGIGDNTDKDASYKLELMSVSFEDIESGKTYDVKTDVLEAFNKGEKVNSLETVITNAVDRSKETAGENAKVAIKGNPVKA